MRTGPATSSSLPVCTNIRLNSERNARKKTSGLTDAATRPTGTRLAATTPTEKAVPAASWAGVAAQNSAIMAAKAQQNLTRASSAWMGESASKY